MKIGTSIETGAAAPSRGARENVATPSTGAGAPASVERDKVSLSGAGAQIGVATADFDEAKVNAIRDAIREGRFTVNAGAIADRLIADAKALVGPQN